MMTETRHDRVQVALHALLPEGFTWEERCEPEWLEAFPCGMAPLFRGGTTVSVCTDRVVEVGAHLGALDFESLLDALVVWVGSTRIAFTQGGADDSGETVLSSFMRLEPVETMVLEAAAAHHGMKIRRFLGIGRGDAA